MFKTALHAALVLVLAGWFQGAWAQSKTDSGITLIGRGDKVTVVDKSGKTQEVDTKKLRVNNSAVSTDRSSVSPAKADEKGSAKEDTKDKDTKDAKKDEAPAKDAPAAETSPGSEEDPKKKAAREKEETDRKNTEKEKLRGLVNQGAWLYDASGRPLSAEEVTKRIESGDIGGIKTVDIHQQEWQTAPAKEPGKDKVSDAKSGTGAGKPADKNTTSGNSSKKTDTSANTGVSSEKGKSTDTETGKTPEVSKQ